MSDWQWLLAVLVAAFFAYGYYHDHFLKPKRYAKQMAEADERRTSEEYVIEKQLKFEKRLREGRDLPDGIRGREAHIYLHLMREWFSKLAAQSRYDEAKVKRIRKDWLIYMEALEQRGASRFLALDGSDQATRDKYATLEEEEHRQIVGIEDAFAHAIGPVAVEKLQDIRLKRYDSFSEAGDLAPDGYRFGVSWPGQPEKPVPRDQM
jgi:hypothetical protein